MDRALRGYRRSTESSCVSLPSRSRNPSTSRCCVPPKHRNSQHFQLTSGRAFWCTQMLKSTFQLHVPGHPTSLARMIADRLDKPLPHQVHKSWTELKGDVLLQQGRPKRDQGSELREGLASLRGVT